MMDIRCLMYAAKRMKVKDVDGCFQNVAKMIVRQFYYFGNIAQTQLNTGVDLCIFLLISFISF